MKSSITRFWADVVEEEKPINEGFSVCWRHIGPNANGYALYRSVHAHRAVAAIVTGQFPSKVTHRCGNRRCVRPDHLIITNMKDRKPKVSKLTGRVILPPVHRDEKLIESVLRDKETLDNMAIIASRNKCSFITVRKIFKEVPLYDILKEVNAYKEAKLDWQRKPHKKFSDLLPREKFVYAKSLTGVTKHAT